MKFRGSCFLIGFALFSFPLLAGPTNLEEALNDPRVVDRDGIQLSLDRCEAFDAAYADYVQWILSFSLSSSLDILSKRGLALVQEAGSLPARGVDFWNKLDEQIVFIQRESDPSIKEMRIGLLYRYLISAMSQGLLDKLPANRLSYLFELRNQVGAINTKYWKGDQISGFPHIGEIDVRVDRGGPILTEEMIWKFYRTLWLSHLADAASFPDFFNRASSVSVPANDLWRGENGFYSQVLREGFDAFLRTEIEGGRDSSQDIEASLKEFFEMLSRFESFFLFANPQSSPISPEFRTYALGQLVDLSSLRMERLISRIKTSGQSDYKLSLQSQQVFLAMLDALRIADGELTSELKLRLSQLFNYGLNHAGDLVVVQAWFNFTYGNVAAGNITSERLTAEFEALRSELGLDWVARNALKLMKMKPSFKELSQIFGLALPENIRGAYKEKRAAMLKGSDEPKKGTLSKTSGDSAEPAETKPGESVIKRMFDLLSYFDLPPAAVMAFREIILASEKIGMEIPVQDALDLSTNQNFAGYLKAGELRRITRSWLKEVHRKLEEENKGRIARGEKPVELDDSLKQIHDGSLSFFIRSGGPFIGCRQWMGRFLP